MRAWTCAAVGLEASSSRPAYSATHALDPIVAQVQLIAPADHWEAEEEILAGRLDVAVTETLHLAQDAAKGKPVMGFSRFLHTDGGVMFLESANITRPKDMCGTTISYPGAPGCACGTAPPTQHATRDTRLDPSNALRPQAGRPGHRADDGRGRRRRVRALELRQAQRRLLPHGGAEAGNALCNACYALCNGGFYHTEALKQAGQ